MESVSVCGPGLSGGVVDRHTPFETAGDSELDIGETANETEETELRDIISSNWDLLVWYNNLDVKPFLLALDSQSEIYKEKGIDMLTRAISLPGLAVLWMFNTIGYRLSLKEAFEKNKAGHSFFGAVSVAVKETRRLHLIDEENHHLYKLFRENLVRGPSLVFHRYH